MSSSLKKLQRKYTDLQHIKFSGAEEVRRIPLTFSSQMRVIRRDTDTGGQKRSPNQEVRRILMCVGQE
jgi:hypothetical protein